MPKPTPTTGSESGIFTDGGCSPNPGPGGWAFVVVQNGIKQDEAFGGEHQTTNNRMELTAILRALEYCRDKPLLEPVTLYADSDLCVQTYNSWMASWEARGWKRKTGPVENLDLVQQLAALKKQCPLVKVQWIKAHAGFRWNEYADRLVQQGRNSLR
jgi:ribonuclease HI